MAFTLDYPLLVRRLSPIRHSYTVNCDLPPVKEDTEKSCDLALVTADNLNSCDLALATAGSLHSYLSSSQNALKIQIV